MAKSNSMKLNLLVLRCRNIDKTKEFYEKLGIYFTKEKHGKGPAHYCSKIEELIFELYPAKNNECDNTRLGFKVTDLMSKLENIEVTSTYEFNSEKIKIIQDPDGRKIELYNKKP